MLARMEHDNYYETAISCFTASIEALGPEVVAKQNQAVMYNLVYGLRRLAEGLLQQNHELESRLAEIAKRLPPRQ